VVTGCVESDLAAWKQVMHVWDEFFLDSEHRDAIASLDIVRVNNEMAL
jgi:hypothetical protein